MRTSIWLLLITAALLGGCNVAAWGNMIVVAMTVALFCGTLTLGRRLPTAPEGTPRDRESVEG